MTFLRIVIPLYLLFEHDLSEKPVPTFPDHALAFLLCSFELSGPFDQHQEQNARHSRAFLISHNFCSCEMIFSSRRAA
jgi:hypothetical protein